MNAQSNIRKIVFPLAAGLLWLLTIGLGLEAIYLIKEIFYLVYVRLGGGLESAETFAPVLLFFLALIFLVFVIATSEYHRTRIGRTESWRLFGWSIGVEVSIVILYYLL